MTNRYLCYIIHKLSDSETKYAAIAQQVERILGKDEVASSNLASSSKTERPSIRMGVFVLPLLPDSNDHIAMCRWHIAATS